MSIPGRPLNFQDSEEPLCFYGIGHLLEDCYDQLVLALGREPDFLCDSSPAKAGKVFRGIPCVSPEELTTRSRTARIVITVKRHERIQEQLQTAGFHSLFLASFDRGHHHLLNLHKLGSMSPPFEGQALDPALRWALVTGSSRGIGRQIALAMAGLGANLVLHARTESNLVRTSNDCQKLGAQVVVLPADLGLPGSLNGMLDFLCTRAPPIDFIFNNSAIFPDAPDFWSVSERDLQLAFQVNALAPIRICQRLIPAMLERGFGRVVNVTSSVHSQPRRLAYACSKACMDKFTQDLAPSLEGTGVMISLLDPGWLRTEMGGSDSPNAVECVIPGALLGALAPQNINGRWLGAMDYAGLTLDEAMAKAAWILSKPISK